MPATEAARRELRRNCQPQGKDGPVPCSVRLRSRPDPLVDDPRRLAPVGVLRKPLGVVLVLVVQIAVPVDESHERGSVGRCQRNRSPEGVVDALLIDVGLIPGMTEREDAQPAVDMGDQTPIDPLDRVGVRGS
jgi:hypothetical protein